MATVEVAADIDLPARTVWDLVGDFTGIAKWHPRIESCATAFKDDATQRHVTTVDGETFVHQFESADYRARAHSYVILVGPLPVRGYRATVRVLDRKRGKAATVEWSCKFTVDKAHEAAVRERVAAFYQAGLEGLRSQLAKADRATKRKADRKAARAAKAASRPPKPARRSTDLKKRTATLGGKS